MSKSKAVYLWLDDIRPAPTGWAWARTVDEAKKIFSNNYVEMADLDHDLGACDECMQGMSAEEWLEKNHYQSMPNCDHFGTGYQLLCWMEENNIWPPLGVKIHTANPVGREKMRTVVMKAYDEKP